LADTVGLLFVGNMADTVELSFVGNLADTVGLSFTGNLADNCRASMRLLPPGFPSPEVKRKQCGFHFVSNPGLSSICKLMGNEGLSFFSDAIHNQQR
jgi:hypothetical protein